MRYTKKRGTEFWEYPRTSIQSAEGLFPDSEASPMAENEALHEFIQAKHPFNTWPYGMARAYVGTNFAKLLAHQIRENNHVYRFRRLNVKAAEIPSVVVCRKRWFPSIQAFLNRLFL